MPQQHPAADPYGSHRVLSPTGAAPGQAWKLNPNVEEFYSNEILLDVEALSIDAGSFRQIEGSSGVDDEGIMRLITRTVKTRGKQHNPVTGSGGVLMGKVAAIGSDLQGKIGLEPGERIVSLASLTATPLQLEKVRKVNRESGQVEVRGQAVLFEAYPFAKLPTDMPASVALAVLSVCSAPALCAKLAEGKSKVLILGAAGKSGLLCAAACRKVMGDQAKIVGIDSGDDAIEQARELGLYTDLLLGNAADPLLIRELCAAKDQAGLFDLVISCVNAGEVEMSAMLAVKELGALLFFSSSTNFNRAAYSAQLCSKEVELRIGGTYVKGQSDVALGLVREHEGLKALFKKRYA
ncbi:MAG: L-erythro-3,5-diaminohexanoate dehydrogenase [Myxococcales bacterium]|nr:MAG: L-erythro-3,5-diaminohexanoate dehydrogenase [Myxococcales bacterium]